ncbi:MAG: hypothetical protein EGR86_04150 [Ruminiclostridium sp.]|nr:hypothetical protein [Ruminiclostridium sp.]
MTAKSLVNKKGGCIASKTQQSDSLCLAVNPPPFDKGGKFSAGRGIVRKISLMVLMGSNPHHSWLGLTEQQNLTLFRVEARMVRGEG